MKSTKVIEYCRNLENQIIIKINGKYLCSYKNPIKEAQQWIMYNDKHFSSDNLNVVGLGSAYHILELIRLYPNKWINIYDIHIEIHKHIMSFLCEKSTLSNPKINIIDPTTEEGLPFSMNSILAFRPSWQSYEVEFNKIYYHLLGRNLEGLQAQCSEYNLSELRNLTNQLDKDRVISMKSIKQLFPNENPKNEESKIWLTLGELVE